MKFLAVIGVLAIFTGSLASGDPQDVLTVEKLMDILSGLPMMAIPLSKKLERSKSGPILSEVYENVSQSLQNAWEELPAEVKETVKLGGNILEGILKKWHRAIIDLNQKADVRQPLIEVMSYYGDPVLERLGRYLKEFEATFENVLKPLYVKVSTEYENYLDDQLYRYIKNWEDAHPTLRGFADQVMTRFRQDMEALHKNLKPRLKPILEEIEKYKTEFRQWVDTPIIPPNA